MNNTEHIFDDFYDIDGTYKVISCKSCGFHHVYPYPDNDFLNTFYSREYKDNFSKINLVEKVLRLKEITKSSEILDIGCGDGALLLEFENQGFNSFGIEPSQDRAKECVEKGLNVRNEFCDRNEFGKKFELINLSYVLEHVQYPYRFIENIKKEFLADGGYLSIEVPNDFNLLQKIYSSYHKDNPYWIHFPDHLNYWDFDSFKKILTDVGFEIVYQTSSFPLEMFLLMDEDYIKNKDLGSIIHSKRLKFEAKFKETGNTEELFRLYQKLSELNIGREIHVVAKMLS